MELYFPKCSVDNLNIIYVDMSDIITYKVQLRDLTEWIKTRIFEIEEALDDKTIPTGQVSGLCQFCRYQTRCYNDRNGLTTKPMSRCVAPECLKLYNLPRLFCNPAFFKVSFINFTAPPSPKGLFL